MKRLQRDFYARDTLTVARELLGKLIIHETEGNTLIGKIVEVEAYIGPWDKAAHSYKNRRSQRNDIMYGPAGFAYVFIIYGFYPCMNIVTAEADKPEAVLIRALEPMEGLETMSENRFKKSYSELNKTSIKNLTNGPGKLCMAMNIKRSNNGDDLCGENLYVVQCEEQEGFEVVTTKRINIDYAEEAIDYPWRYYIKDNPYVSKK